MYKYADNRHWIIYYNLALVTCSDLSSFQTLCNINCKSYLVIHGILNKIKKSIIIFLILIILTNCES